MPAGREPNNAERAIAHNVRAYDAIGASYDAGHPEIFNPIEADRLTAAVDEAVALCATEHRPRRVLDVGSGTGNLTAHFLAHGAEVVSADVSPACLALTADRFRESGRHAVQLIDGQSLAAFADESFDIVACYSVLHHVPDYLALVAEMARVARRGGVVYIDHERLDTSWTDPVRDAFVAEAWRFPPKRWTRYLDPRRYWRRLRFHLQWRRWRDPRWMPEGDLHIWPDDHIEWAKVEASARTFGVVRAVVRDHLLYDAHYDRAVWERWNDRLADYRCWMGRKV